jgi:hypothetical protein
VVRDQLSLLRFRNPAPFGFDAELAVIAAERTN